MLDSLHADLLIVQECEDPKQSLPAYQEWAGNYLWKGRNRSRGIGVFAVNSTIERLTWNRKFRVSGAAKSSSSASWKTDDLQEFLMVRVNNQINVVAVWTKQVEGGTFSYAGQLWKFLQSHRKDMIKNECLLIGDLNSNVQWDRAGRWWNHSDNVAILEEIGMLSLYHELEGVAQGDEAHPTFYMYRNPEKAYHMDYAFASDALRAGAKFSVLQPSVWLEYSDHMPLVLDLALEGDL